MTQLDKRVLVVEDDEAIRLLLSDVLHEGGYAVDFANNGAAAIQSMMHHLPDLVLLDLMLPDMTGWQFLDAQSGQRQLAEVPVLVVSAAESEGLEDAQTRGAPVYLQKPFDVQALLDEVQRLIAAPIRQCAWCGRVRDRYGEFSLHSGRNLRWATHGICPFCKQRYLAQLSS